MLCLQVNPKSPMQWNSADNAGFTGGVPYIPIGDDYKTVNAKVCSSYFVHFLYVYVAKNPM